MSFFKKSLGQNFLIDKNVIKKIVNLADIKNKNVIEIGPGKGALTDEILNKSPKSLYLIEKDRKLFEYLKKKYSKIHSVKIYNDDILNFNVIDILKKHSIIFGNLPYNISSQILVKILKIWPVGYTDVIFMFQKELGEKIISKFPSPNYGRLSILTYFRLKVLKKFLVSENCFSPKPRVISMVVHFLPKKNMNYKIDNLKNLEKITNILFSNKRKMIRKNINKILNKYEIENLRELKLNLRPAQIKPETYYKITELYEKK